MINPRSVAAAVRASNFLAGLEQPAMHAILAAAQIRRISAKHNITTGGDRATHLFLVQSGRVRFYHLTKQGGLVLLASLVPWVGGHAEASVSLYGNRRSNLRL
jgi:CRP-like cAMP-binding protein